MARLLCVTENKTNTQMEFDALSNTTQARSLRYQRVVYIVSMATSTSKMMGVDAQFCKIGISKCDAFSRFCSYKTYWPSGVLVHAIAVVNQPHMSDTQVVRKVEADLYDCDALKEYRIRHTESFLNPNAFSIRYAIAFLCRHASVVRVWEATPCGKYGSWHATRTSHKRVGAISCVGQTGTRVEVEAAHSGASCDAAC